MALVTLEEMIEAIRRTLVAHGKIPQKMAEKVAMQVLSYFGSEETIVDNTLSTKDRDVFYWLEEEGLLSSEVETTVVENSKTWRIHYWLLNVSAIRTASGKKEKKETDASALYETLPLEDWAHGQDGKGPTAKKP